MSEHDLGDEFETYMLVVAHPDDSEFSSAGTVARLKDAGKRVVLIQVTSGDKGTPDADTDPAELGRTREAEQLEAARVLGMDEVVFLRCEEVALFVGESGEAPLLLAATWRAGSVSARSLCERHW